MAERFTRSFNYPEDSCIKTKEDLGRMGIKTFFASNVCCAYDREEVLGSRAVSFIRPYSTEDMIFAGKAVLQDDYAVAYVAEAESFTPTIMGARPSSAAISTWLCPRQTIRRCSQAFTRRAREYVWSDRQPVTLVTHRRPWLVPGLIVKSGFKYAGYRLGRCYRFLPVKLAAACSMNKEYWK